MYLKCLQGLVLISFADDLANCITRVLLVRWIAMSANWPWLEVFQMQHFPNVMQEKMKKSNGRFNGLSIQIKEKWQTFRLLHHFPKMESCLTVFKRHCLELYRWASKSSAVPPPRGCKQWPNSNAVSFSGSKEQSSVILSDSLQFGAFFGVGPTLRNGSFTLSKMYPACFLSFRNLVKHNNLEGLFLW